MRREVIGDCELWLGDCREVLPQITADVCVTDPPYGVTYQSNYRVGEGSRPITNDGTRVSLRLYRQVVPLLAGMPTLWFTRWDAWPDVWEILAQHMQIKGLLVWDKGHNGMGDLNHWGNSHEMVASAGPVRCRGGRDGSVLRFTPVPPNSRNHPTEKPVELLRYLIEKISDPGQTVVDPFCGSGTTGLAAVASGRRFVGVEIYETYFDTACRRLERAASAPRFFTEPPAKPVQAELLTCA